MLQNTYEKQGKHYEYSRTVYFRPDFQSAQGLHEHGNRHRRFTKKSGMSFGGERESEWRGAVQQCGSAGGLDNDGIHGLGDS